MAESPLLPQGNHLLAEKRWKSRELAQSGMKFRCPNKIFVLRKAAVDSAASLAACYKPEDEVVFTRWDTLNLPQNELISESCNQEFIQGTFTYPTYDESKEYHWHLNFANCDLFVAYAGSLYAQDEMQVLEHPILASLREALNEIDQSKRKFLLESVKLGGDVEKLMQQKEQQDPNFARNLCSYTNWDSRATPILIEGAQRKLVVAVDPNCAQGRPFGLYGNQFAHASTDTIAKALTVFTDNNLPYTNLIAMEAPVGGYGGYNAQTIETILQTTLSGFRAAVIQTKRSRPVGTKCVIHTGHWGTGAYGGNRVLMAFLQILSSHIVGVHKLIFYTFDKKGTEDYQTALNLIREICSKPKELSDIINILVEKNFTWGVSDGN